MADCNNIQHNNPSSASFSAQEMLSYLDQNGIIDVGSVETQMRAARRKKLLDSHPYLISQGKDGRWRTYIKDPKQPHGRKMIVKSSREKVEDLKEDNAVLREDVKDLRIIKRAMRPQAFEDLLNQAKAAAQEREWGR